jgi:predicted DsbA family dithiol-disulfide isomerase
MNDSRVLALYYDYVDPASFLMEERLRRLEGSGGYSIVLEPFEGVPPPEPLVDPSDEGWADHWRPLAEFGLSMGLELKRPWIVPWTRKAHELAFKARNEGCFPEIHLSLFRAYLLEGLDIGRIDVLVELARSCGMDALETKVALDVDLYRESVLERRRLALEVGVTRPPALLCGEERLDGFPEERVLLEFLAHVGDRET